MFVAGCVTFGQTPLLRRSLFLRGALADVQLAELELLVEPELLMSPMIVSFRLEENAALWIGTTLYRKSSRAPEALQGVRPWDS